MALSHERALLRLKRMEAALIRSHLVHPEVLPQADYELLRYALVLGRLQAFTPGVAGAVAGSARAPSQACGRGRGPPGAAARSRRRRGRPPAA